ncbi:MAG: acetylxylan esterase [Lentisphaerota bacterium]
MKLWLVLLLGAAAMSAPLYAEAPKSVDNAAELSAFDLAKVDIKGVVVPGKVSFSPGEEMIFEISVDFGGQTAPQQYSLTWQRTGDDGKTVKGSSGIAPGKTVIIKTSMDKPGFVYIKGNLVDSQGKNVVKTVQQWGTNAQQALGFDGGAGVDIDKMVQAVPEPADFDAYWINQKKLLNAVPVKATMVKVSKEGTPVDVFAVSVDCSGPRPVSGYLTIPAKAADKSLPAVVSYQGYGTTVQQPPPGDNPNAIRFMVNAHGYDLGKDKAYYEKFFNGIKSNGKSYGADPIQNAKPETAYFNGMVLRVMRSLQFIKTLPQWDGKNLTAEGGSQGGMQTMWAAGLDSDVSLAQMSITGGCDMGGSTIGRLKGWIPDWIPTFGYFDSVNHAKRIKCPVDITRVGLGDYTCPPSGIAISYNVIKAPKKIHYVQGSTHGFIPKNPQVMDMKAK